MTTSRSVRRVWVHKPTRDKLSVRGRAFGMTPNDVVRLRRVQRLMSHVIRAIEVLPAIFYSDERLLTQRKDELLKIFAILALQWKDLVAVPQELNSPLSRI